MSSLGGTHHRDTTFTKIFVGGLPYHTSDQTLRSYFEPFGDITEAVVITDRQTGKSRGYGFVSLRSFSTEWSKKLEPVSFLPLTSSNLNRFAKFFHSVKEKKMSNASHVIYSPHLKYVAALPCEITYTLKYDANLEGNENKMH